MQIDIHHRACEKCKETKTTDAELYGYDWHQHEFRFGCRWVDGKKGCNEYHYVQMRTPWHDMTQEERTAEIEYAYGVRGKLCSICRHETYLI